MKEKELENVIVGLDVGTTKICTIVAQKLIPPIPEYMRIPECKKSS